MRDGDGAGGVRALLRNLRHADSVAAGRGGAEPPLGLLAEIARTRIAPLDDEPRHRAVQALPIVEPRFDELQNVRDGLRRFFGIGLEREYAFRRLDDDDRAGVRLGVSRRTTTKSENEANGQLFSTGGG